MYKIIQDVVYSLYCRLVQSIIILDIKWTQLRYDRNIIVYIKLHEKDATRLKHYAKVLNIHTHFIS